MKKNKWTITGLALIILLGITTAICAFVKMDFAPKLSKQYAEIKVSGSDLARDISWNVINGEMNEHEIECYNEFLKLCYDSFKMPVLNYIFSSKPENNNNVSYGTSADSESGLKIEFRYSDWQNIYNKGILYKNPTDTSKNAQFKSVYFYIANTEGYQIVTFYYYDDSNKDNKVYYKQESYGNFLKLYEYLTELQ